LPVISGSHPADSVIVRVSYVYVVVLIDANASWSTEASTNSESINMSGFTAAATNRHNLASSQGHLANAMLVDHDEVVVAVDHECVDRRKACGLARCVIASRSTSCHKTHFACIEVNFVDFVGRGNEEPSPSIAAHGLRRRRKRAQHMNQLRAKIEETDLVDSARRL